MAIFLITMVIIAALEVPRMLKNKQYRALVVFFGFWLTSGIYAGLVIMRVPIPSPVDILMAVAERFGL